MKDINQSSGFELSDVSSLLFKFAERPLDATKEVIIHAGEIASSAAPIRHNLYWYRVAFLRIMTKQAFSDWDLRLDVHHSFYQRWLGFTVYWMTEFFYDCDECQELSVSDVPVFQQAAQGFPSNQHPEIEVLNFLTLTEEQCQAILFNLKLYLPAPSSQQSTPTSLVDLLYCAVDTGFIELANLIIQIPGFDYRVSFLDDRPPSKLAAFFGFKRMSALIATKEIQDLKKIS